MRFNGRITTIALVFTIFAEVSFSSCATAQTAERLYENSSASPLVELLNSAHQSLDIEIYDMDDSLVMKTLRAAVDRHVKVRVVKDGTPVGSACKVFKPAARSDSASCADQKTLMNYIIAHQGQYVPFNKQVLCGKSGGHCYEHGKMVIVDQHRVMISTGNFNTTSLCSPAESHSRCNRDYSVVSDEANVVNTFRTFFENDLRGQAYDVAGVLTQNGTAQKITVSPFSLNPIVALIQSAQKTIQIQNQYLKDPDMNLAIAEAAKRGVQVFVNVSSFCSFAQPSTAASRNYSTIFNLFDEAGVHTRLFTQNVRVKNENGYLHAKAILVDSAVAWVGSVNGSATSLSSNREFGIFLSNPADVQTLATYLYSDYSNAGTESWQEGLACKLDHGGSSDPSGDDEEPLEDLATAFH
jgi:cardiolipin synthase